MRVSDLWACVSHEEHGPAKAKAIGPIDCPVAIEIWNCGLKVLQESRVQ